MNRKLKLFITRILKCLVIVVYKIMYFAFPPRANRVVISATRHEVLKDNLHYLYSGGGRKFVEWKMKGVTMMISMVLLSSGVVNEIDEVFIC